MTIHNLVILSLKQYHNTVTPYGIHTNILHAENHNEVQNNLPLRNAVRRSNLVAFPYYLTLTNARRARCAPNKHHEMPFERSILCSSLLLFSNLPLRNAVRRSNLVTFPYYLTLTSARRARCAPNKHHEMPFERGIPCSSLLPLS